MRVIALKYSFAQFRKFGFIEEYLFTPFTIAASIYLLDLVVIRFFLVLS